MIKVEIKTKNQMPAGIFSGIEAFWYDNQKWIIANGQVKLFDECDSTIQQPIWQAFLADKQSHAYLKKIGITKASETFERWYRCVVGGLDSVPDFDRGRFTPDKFNNMCTDTTCTLRGILCSRAAGLKNYEVETLGALKQGESMERTASRICVSLPGMKSRVEHIKQKMNVTNMAALMAKTAELGI